MADKGTVTLAIAGSDPQAFDPSVEGVEIITAEGTKIPAGKEEDVRKAAKDNDVRLTKVD